MIGWQDELSRYLRQAKRIVILGAGSVLCGDDAAGMLIAAELKNLAKGEKERVLVLEGSTAPECFTGVIRDYRPDFLLLIDAAHISDRVGDIDLIPRDQIAGMEFSTHMLPFGILLDYLQSELPDCVMKVLGINPGQVDFGTEPSKLIRCQCKALAETLWKMIISN